MRHPHKGLPRHLGGARHNPAGSSARVGGGYLIRMRQRCLCMDHPRTTRLDLDEQCCRHETGNQQYRRPEIRVCKHECMRVQDRVNISVSSTAGLTQAIDAVTGRRKVRRRRQIRWSRRVTGTGFYLGLLGRAGVFALVLWLDLHPEFSCAVHLTPAARVCMFLFHQIACPVLILIVYFQVCLWATHTHGVRLQICIKGCINYICTCTCTFTRMNIRLYYLSILYHLTQIFFFIIPSNVRPP